MSAVIQSPPHEVARPVKWSRDVLLGTKAEIFLEAVLRVTVSAPVVDLPYVDFEDRSTH